MKKKMLGCDGVCVRARKSNPVTKTTDSQPGHVQRRRARCGKPNCECSRDELHTAYYHAWDTDGVRYRKYLRREDVDAMRAACEAHRAL